MRVMPDFERLIFPGVIGFRAGACSVTEKLQLRFTRT